MYKAATSLTRQQWKEQGLKRSQLGSLNGIVMDHQKNRNNSSENSKDASTSISNLFFFRGAYDTFSLSPAGPRSTYSKDTSSRWMNGLYQTEDLRTDAK